MSSTNCCYFVVLGAHLLGVSSMMPPDRHEIHIRGLIKDAIEVDRDSSLYFVCFPEGFKPPPLPPPRPTGGDDDVGRGAGAELFCGTDEYVYQHFFADFGPLHLGHVWAFCRKLRALERQQGQQHEKGGGDRHEEKKKPVYVYSSDHPHRRSNAVVLVVAYAVSERYIIVHLKNNFELWTAMKMEFEFQTVLRQA